jgi:chemotaxis signal transduction protein
MQEEDKRADDRVLTFQAGGGFFGIPLEWVIAVRSGIEDAPSGETVDFLLFEGEEIALFDLSAWLGKGNLARRSSSMLVLGRTCAAAAAVIDSPGRVVGALEVYGWPKMCRSMAGGVVTGVMDDQDQLVLLLDPEALLRVISEEPDTRSQGGERL